MAATTESRDEATDASAESAIESSEASIPRILKTLVGIQSGSGTPIFSDSLDDAQAENIIDSFVSQQSEITDESSTAALFQFSNDILILKSSDDRATKAGSGPRADNPYYSAYYKGSQESINAMLQYNYNMSEAEVAQSFTGIFNSIVQELSPPKSSRTFAYDFKFSQNQNGSITTGSVRPVRTRAARSSGGGGY